MVDFHNGMNLQNLNHASVGQVFPGQAQNQGVKLQSAQFLATHSAPPVKAPLIQTSIGQPDAMTVMHQHFHPVAAPIGKQVGMVRQRTTKHLNYSRQDCFRSGAHVEWFD